MRSLLPARPERSYSTIEIQPAPPIDVLGVQQPATSYGSDAKTPLDLVGMTANEAADMQPPLRFFTFDQMRREDAAVKSALWLVTQPIRSALWSLVPASEDPADKIVADALRWQFGMENRPSRMDMTWREQVNQKCMKIAYGCMFEEIVVPPDRIDLFYDADGDPHPIRPFSRLMPLWPQTIKPPDGIQTDKTTGLISSLEQLLPGARPVPGGKMAWYVLDREGTDWYGTSMLRPMKGAWQLKRAVMISAGIGWDRFAFGTPVIRYPFGGGQLRKREAENIGRNWRAHERGYFVLEGGQDKGWSIELMGSGQMQDPTPLIHTYDEQIAAAALQHFIVLGRSATGSRAVGDALSEPYYMFLQTVADDIAEETSRHVFRKWVDLNFGEEFELPKLVVSKLQSRNVAVLAAALAALADAGFSYTDPDTQNDIREILDLRRLPEPLYDHMVAVMNGDPGAGIGPGQQPPGAGGSSPPLPPSQRIPTNKQDGQNKDPTTLIGLSAEGEGLGY